MRKVQIILGLLAFVMGDLAAREYCPGGDGYWDYEERQVRVCDYVTETYTESNRHCGYSGQIYLSVNDSLWYPPVFPTDYNMHASSSKVLAVTASCPTSDYKSDTRFYWYTDRTGSSSGHLHRWGWYNGNIPLISDRVDTQTKTRTIETNCRIETQTVAVWRCGQIP